MKSIFDLYRDAGIGAPYKYRALNLTRSPSGCKISVIGGGDVGRTLILGLLLRGGDLISRIGLFDTDRNNAARLEMEFGQIAWPGETDYDGERAPGFFLIEDEKEIFDADIVVFTAAKEVPPVNPAGKVKDSDIRMVQFEENALIVRRYAEIAKNAGFQGLYIDMSDPVDQLAMEFLIYSGLDPGQIRGFGLGVMNARARYFARQDREFESYLTEGRVYCQHGEGLCLINNISDYDEDISERLRRLTVDANIMVRKHGYKPYIAPGISSGALSIIDFLKGKYIFSSLFFGGGSADGKKRGAFLGIRNRLEGIEDLPLPDNFYNKVFESWNSMIRDY